jgi:hypothetical protein
MKYAFPEAEGVMIVSHLEKYSAVGLYTQAGRAPNCLIAKHETREGISFFWSTEFDPPRAIADLAEIINAHIRAIGLNVCWCRERSRHPHVFAMLSDA